MPFDDELEKTGVANYEKSEQEKTEDERMEEVFNQPFFNRREILIFLGIAVIIIAIEIIISKSGLQSKLISVVKWMQDNPSVGLSVSLSLLIIMSVFSIPGHGMFLLCAGMILKNYLWAQLLNILAEVVIVTLATLIGKRMKSFADWLVTENPKMLVAKKLVESDGLFMIVLIRATVAIHLGSYLFANLKVDNNAYFIGTAICILMHTISSSLLGVLIGQSTDDGTQDERLNYIIMLIMFGFELFFSGSCAILLRRAYRNLKIRFFSRKGDPEYTKVESSAFTRKEKIAFGAIITAFCLLIAIGVPVINFQFAPKSASSLNSTQLLPFNSTLSAPVSSSTAFIPTTTTISFSATPSPTGFDDNEP